MLRKLSIIMAVIAALSASGATPQREISALMEKYPEAERKVWYYFDSRGGREYLRLQLLAGRQMLADDDVARLTMSFRQLWNITDFNESVGTQYFGPDTVSMTIKGDRVAVYDLGRRTLSADYAFNTTAKARGEKPDFRNLEQTFAEVAGGRRTASTHVRYTGFKPGVTFTFQRGQGRGWTSGSRITVFNASINDFRRLRVAIRSFIGSKVPVTVYDRTWQVLIKSESTPDFYAVGYDKSTKQLNFLHVKVEDQICVPLEWQKIDYLTNEEIKYKH